MTVWSNPWPRQSGCARRPVIGVLCCNGFSQRPVQAVATRFVQPLADHAGAAVVLIPAVSDACDALALVDRLDGLLLTGSRSNVAATHYGAARDDNGPGDEQRDEVALRRAAHMIEGARPVFGICRGLQELNVLFGGTLTDDLDEVHHCGLADGTQYDRHFEHRHGINLTSGGMLHAQAGIAGEVVNSVHHQGIDRLSHGLAVEATASDDRLVEAFSARPAAPMCWRYNGTPSGTSAPAAPAAPSSTGSAQHWRLGCGSNAGSHNPPVRPE